MSRRSPRDRPLDEGMTLVEVLVATSLSVMLLVVVGSFTVVGMRASDAASARTDNITAAGVGMAAASKVIRTAVLPDQLDDRACTGCADSAIVQATTSQMSFYANINNTGNGPSLVTLQTVNDSRKPGTTMLQQTMVPPTVLSDGSYTFCDIRVAGCTFTTRILTRGLPSTPTVFNYYDFSGVLITGTALSAADLIRVASIDVTLKVQLRPGQTRTPSETVVQRVTLPNADVNVLTEES